MQSAVAQFVERVQRGDTVAFVYSGHGWSDGKTNYVVGVDAPSSASEELLTRVSLPLRNGLNGVLDDFERKDAGLKVVIIDACRDNPFRPPPGHRGYGLARGLKPQSVEGSFVIYSAGEGHTVLDRLSDADADSNSVFTRTLLPLLRADLPLIDAVKASQERTHALAAAADHAQMPAYYDEVLGRACLSAVCKSIEETLPSASDAAVANMIDSETNAKTLEDWIARFPEGPLRQRAEKRLTALRGMHPATSRRRRPNPVRTRRRGVSSRSRRIGGRAGLHRPVPSQRREAESTSIADMLRQKEASLTPAPPTPSTVLSRSVTIGFSQVGDESEWRPAFSKDMQEEATRGESIFFSPMHKAGKRSSLKQSGPSSPERLTRSLLHRWLSPAGRRCFKRRRERASRFS